MGLGHGHTATASRNPTKVGLNMQPKVHRHGERHQPHRPLHAVLKYLNLASTTTRQGRTNLVPRKWHLILILISFSHIIS